MPYTPQTPSDVIADWTENGTTVSFPIASVPELDAAEADAATGDARKVIYALAEQFYQWYLALGVDRPDKLAVTRSSQLDETTGAVLRTYTISVHSAPIAPGVLEVADEPA